MVVGSCSQVGLVIIMWVCDLILGGSHGGGGCVGGDGGFGWPLCFRCGRL